MNPNASIYCFNIEVNAPPADVLKLLQASIAAYTGGAPPSNPGGGINLFEVNEGTLDQYVREKLTPDLVREFIKLGLLELPQVQALQPPERMSPIKAGYGALEAIVAQNVGILQTSSTPVPQADAPQGSQVTAGGETPAALEPLEKGMIDFRRPYATARSAGKQRK